MVLFTKGRGGGVTGVKMFDNLVEVSFKTKLRAVIKDLDMDFFFIKSILSQMLTWLTA